MAIRKPISRKLNFAQPSRSASGSASLSSALSMSPPSASAPTPMSLGTIRDHIESLLDPATRRNFANTANHLIRLGLRNGKHLEPRRQKLRGIVEANRQIWRLYNEYASVHIVAEKRVTYRLPVFRDLVDEEEEDGDEMEIEEEEEDEGAESEATEQSQDPTDTPNSKMANIIPRPHTRANLMRQHNGTSELSAFETESANNQEEQTSDKESSETLDKSPEWFATQEESDEEETPSTPTDQIDTDMVDADSPCQRRSSLRVARAKSSPSKHLEVTHHQSPAPQRPRQRREATPHSPTQGNATQQDVMGNGFVVQEEVEAYEKLPDSPMNANDITMVEAEDPYRPSDDLRPSEVEFTVVESPEHMGIATPDTHEPQQLQTIRLAQGPAASAKKVRFEDEILEPMSPAHTIPATVELPDSIDPSPIINPTSPLPPHHRYIIPIINPEALPINRIQDIQALRYPSARIYAMLTHRNVNGDVIQVTADMDAGPVDHLLINDTRIITALELRQPDYDTISIQENILRINETFTIHISPSQRLRYSNDFLVGELRPARHAYLYWLDSRGSADPKCGPWAQEARRIAGKLGRRAPDVWREIEGYWSLEQGAGGKVYRTDRLRYLGEDPVYDEDAGKRADTRLEMMSMWG